MLIWNGRINGLWYGSLFPDAPQIFLDDTQFAQLWTSPHRIYLVTGNEHFAAQHLLDCPNEQLRAAGLSHNKSLALRDLAAKTLDGTVPSLVRIRRMADEDIIEHLTQVRGIGRWTVEMLLIFRLGRPDVLPVSDYGVRKGFALTFGKLKPTDKVTPLDLPKPDEMHRRAKRWAPWRSVASWYMWRACDLANGKLVSSET